MNYIDEYSKLQNILKLLGDDVIWKPFHLDPQAQEEFNTLLVEVEESQSWPSKFNQRKGKLYEKLIRVVLDRFQVGITDSDFYEGDNQIDHEFRFHDQFNSLFTQQVGATFICECKNEQTPVDVTYVSKLIELCDARKSKFGIFFSIKGLTGRGWIFAEGKRKKNFLRHGIAIISFTFDEVKQLVTKNLYTLMKDKYSMLVREVDEELDDIRQYPQEDLHSFHSRLKSTVKQMFQMGLIDREIHDSITQKIDQIHPEE